ncbi:hypothetical protein GCM10017673_30000 [Streptosporangium violaceochromogenes]|nr:hypothetical protein GCM10017673_30000 [Streptosporangium violaceochromogenes]
MRGRHRLLITGALGLALAGGCAAGAPARALPEATAAPDPPPEGFREVDGPPGGLAVAVPRDWIALDLTRDDLGKGLRRSGLAGGEAERAERSLRPLVEHGAIWAADPASIRASPHRFVTNLNGFCQSGPDIPAERVIAEAEGELRRLKAAVSQAGEVTTTGGGRAVRIVYTFAVHGITIRGTQYYVRAPGRICVLTLSTDRDDRQGLFDRIGRTARPR